MQTTIHAKSDRPTLNLVGAGRVGQTLARLWNQAGVFSIQDVHTRSTTSAQEACYGIGAGTPCSQLQAMRQAQVWMVAVPDAALDACATALAPVASTADASILPSPPIVFHCSGALTAELLAPLAASGWRTASAHCLLSFTNVEAASAQFPGTPCALEGDRTATAALQTYFGAIGAQCFDMVGSDKLLYHAAAVFATNFIPVLQATAEDLWEHTGMPPALIAHARGSLLRNATANLTAVGPRAALTGPAARGDLEAITRQHAAVAHWDAGAGSAYAALSDLALRLAARRAR